MSHLWQPNGTYN